LKNRVLHLWFFKKSGIACPAEDFSLTTLPLEPDGQARKAFFEMSFFNP